jgi:hypothetical protein
MVDCRRELCSLPPCGGGLGWGVIASLPVTPEAVNAHVALSIRDMLLGRTEQKAVRIEVKNPSHVLQMELDTRVGCHLGTVRG